MNSDSQSRNTGTKQDNKKFDVTIGKSVKVIKK